MKTLKDKIWDKGEYNEHLTVKYVKEFLKDVEGDMKGLKGRFALQLILRKRSGFGDDDFTKLDNSEVRT